MQQFTSSAEYLKIEEEYLFVMETDHLLLKPIKNQACPLLPSHTQGRMHTPHHRQPFLSLTSDSWPPTATAVLAG